MNKFYGSVGYAVTVEKVYTDMDTGEEFSSSIYEPHIVMRNYYGDILRNRSKRGSANGVNDDINVSHSISIIADPFAYQNFMNIAFVVWQGVKWKVTDVEVESPRLILDIGGVYNDQPDNE